MSQAIRQLTPRSRVEASSMIHFLPENQVSVGPVTLSLHGKLNQLVKRLGVVCTGATGSTLFFDRETDEARNMPPEQLAHAIFNVIMQEPDIMKWIREAPITNITLR
ncbi:MAG: hypothetical protein WB681_08470 [Candidatus Cybelea sp.]